MIEWVHPQSCCLNKQSSEMILPDILFYGLFNLYTAADLYFVAVVPLEHPWKKKTVRLNDQIQ